MGAGWAPYLKDTNVLLGLCLIVVVSFAAVSLKSTRSKTWFATFATAGVFAVATLIIVAIRPSLFNTKNVTDTTGTAQSKSRKTDTIAPQNSTVIKQGDAGPNTVQIVNGSGNLVLNQASGK